MDPTPQREGLLGVSSRSRGLPPLIDCGNGVLSGYSATSSLGSWRRCCFHTFISITAPIFWCYATPSIMPARDLRRRPLPLHAPPEPSAELKRLLYKDLFDIKPLSPGEPLTLGPFNFSFIETLHSLPCLAMRIETEDGLFVYSGDTEYFDGLAEFAAGADLFLCEANLLEGEGGGIPANHLTAAAAARLAAAAGVKRLLLTHFHPERSQALSLKEARVHFAAVERVREGETYLITP